MNNHEILGLSEITVITESWFKIVARKKRDLKFSNGSTKPRRLISVFGSSTVQRRSPRWRAAFDMGKTLAMNNAIVMSGGYGGLMEATSEGAISAGGHTIGITCDNLPERSANQSITSEWKLDRWDQRLIALVWLADGYIILPGSSGTLVELSMVIETQLKGFIPARPIVCLGEFWRPVVKRVNGTGKLVSFARKPEDAVELLLRL